MIFFILNIPLETMGKKEREKRKILAGRKVGFVVVNEAEQQTKLTNKRTS